MENETTFFEPLLERVEAYGKTSYELFKLEAAEKTVNIVSTVFSRSIAIFSLSIFIVFISIGCSLWLGDVLGKMYYGFLCVAGFYGIIGGILYFFMHNEIKKSAANSIVKQMLN